MKMRELLCSGLECTCQGCGKTVTIPRAGRAYHPCPGRGLGDLVAAGLAALGITEERVSAAIGRPCGCGERREKLNELGRKIGLG